MIGLLAVAFSEQIYTLYRGSLPLFASPVDPCPGNESWKLQLSLDATQVPVGLVQGKKRT